MVSDDDPKQLACALALDDGGSSGPARSRRRLLLALLIEVEGARLGAALLWLLPLLARLAGSDSSLAVSCERKCLLDGLAR